MTTTATDASFMARALRLAERGAYGVSPNPRVGCVIVKDGAVVGEGWHARAGEAHAEVVALNAAADAARGATAYVTLEPCNHQGRTGPCSQALIAAGVARVIYAAADEGSQSQGGGDALRAAGVAVEAGLMSASAQALNPGFHRRLAAGRPWVRLKLAQSVDGRTALSDGRSQWITGEAARLDVQRWRARSCAIVTGGGTVLADDPQMNVRLDGTPRQPLRVVLDTHDRTLDGARIFSGEGETLILHGPGGTRGTALPLDPRGRVDVVAAVEELGRRGLNELWFECGPTMAGAALEAGVVDELILYTAPCLIGPGRPLVGLMPLAELAAAKRLDIVEYRRIGGDSRIIARPL